MLKNLPRLALLIFCAASAAASPQAALGDPLDSAVRLPRIDFGPLAIGEDHPLFNLADFPITIDASKTQVSAVWVEDSVKWLRTADGLPVPLARLRVRIPLAVERAVLRWRGRAITLQGGADEASTDVFIPLLEGGEIGVDIDGREDAKIRVAANAASATPTADRHAIDHSCSPWNVAVRGLDDAFLSMNCRLILIGRFGSEESRLEIRWAAAGVSLPDGSPAAMTTLLGDSRPSRIAVVGPDKKSRVAEISAAFTPRWHRLRIAVGAGPYGLSSSAASGNGAAGSLMLYGNFRLRPEDSLSIRTFEAAVSQSPLHTSFFNNLGLYFAYDLARVWDSRLLLTAQLGMQSVTLAPEGLSRKSYSEALFPQGFEITYLDAFGRRGKSLSGGMFLQPTVNKNYQNFWVRYGGRWFGEVNYLSWRSYARYAKMWGVSVGVPLARLF